MSQCRITWAVDLIRTKGPLNRDGLILSRAQANDIINLFVTITGIPKTKMIDKLMDYHKNHEVEIWEKIMKQYGQGIRHS